MEEFTKLIISFLGGGVIAGLISWARIARSERETRKADYIRSQLDNLYGPIYYYTSQNDQLFRLNNKIMGAYTAEYCDKKWSQESTTQKNIMEESTQTIDIANSYVGIVTENNKKVVAIIQNNASFIDPEDNEAFQQFVIDNHRLKIEIEEDGKLITPFRIYKRVGDISFMRSEFINIISQRFTSKVNEIKKFH